MSMTHFNDVLTTIVRGDHPMYVKAVCQTISAIGGENEAGHLTLTPGARKVVEECYPDLEEYQFREALAVLEHQMAVVWQDVSEVHQLQARKGKRKRVSTRVALAVFDRDGYECRKCKTRKNLTVDHVIPVSRGGQTEMDNLQTLCGDCNSRKGSRIE